MITSFLGSIAVLGSGSWGTALVKILTDNGCHVHWWVRNEVTAAYIKARQHNPNYLPSVRFDNQFVSPSANLHQVLRSAKTIIVAIPSAYAQETVDEAPASVWKEKHVVSAIKGILPNTKCLLSEYMALRQLIDLQQYAAITGPCHAEEVAQERLSYLTCSGLDTTLTAALAKACTTDYIRVTYNQDIWGAQYAAVLKNIYAIAAGVAHGLGYGDNFLSVLITNCYREMYQYLKAHFKAQHPAAERPDFHTSAYLGDLLVTCYSLHSRNRMFGTMLGKGYSVKTAMLEMNMVAEGYHASKGMHTICTQQGAEMPLADHIYRILWEAAPADAIFHRIEALLS